MTNWSRAATGWPALDGKKIFVQYAAPQESVRARIVSDKRDYAVARIEQILEPSPLRVEAPCPHYGTCGGCQLQHISYAGQLIVKKLFVNESLQRIGRVFVPVRHATAESPAWHYRNKTQYPAGGNDMTVGFFRRGTHELIDVPACLLHPDEFDCLRESTRSTLLAAGETGYNEAGHSGQHQALVIRRAAPSGELLLIIVTRKPELDIRIAQLLAEQPGVTGVIQSLNPARTNRIMGAQNRVTCRQRRTPTDGPGQALPCFRIVVLPGEHQSGRGAMPQGSQTRRAQGDEKVVDLYSGVGMISLTLAGSVREVIGIELDSTAVEDALVNARVQSAHNVEFICADVNRAIAGSASPTWSCSTRRAVKAVRPRPCAKSWNSGPSGSSTSPATRPRSRETWPSLEQLGYVTHEVEPVDMFPQTFHVEVIARLGPLGSSAQ